MKHLYRIVLSIVLMFVGLEGAMTIIHAAIIANDGNPISFLDYHELMPWLYNFSGIFFIGLILLLVFSKLDK